MASETVKSAKEKVDGGAGDARPRSAEIFERGKKTLVGGVDSPVRAFRAVGGSGAARPTSNFIPASELGSQDRTLRAP